MRKDKGAIKVEVREGIDGITKLSGRSTLEAEVISAFNDTVVEFGVVCGGKRPYSVILFDVDYFKAINDLFGYRQGDAVLSGIGDTLRGYHESHGILGLCGRWGGEEFLIALPYEPSKRAKYIADEIRELVAGYSFEDAKTGQRTLKEFITISAGVSSVDIADFVERLRKEGKEPAPSDIKLRLDRVICESNCALDYAKFMGRNRVEVFRRYLQSELQNLEETRQFYFNISSKKPSDVKNIFEHPFLKRHKSVKNKIRKHFYIIRTEIEQRDTRTKALLADNLYRHVSQVGPVYILPFLQFMKESG
ncbi:GGDEF domain-containing protein [Candidatus Woesearchaeota archaeon]|nr:GGDEF domain-containing protein [Candidatus Woesearchaeota archaeon]